MKKMIAILMVFVLSFALVACPEDAYLAPTSLWCSSMRNLVARADGDTFAADVVSLQKYSQAVELDEMELGSVAEEFLGYAMQLADLMQGYDSFFDMPHFEQQAILEAWYILANANYAESEAEYSSIIESNARVWLDAYMSGSSGQTLPLN